jgi:hypothetical protein
MMMRTGPARLAVCVPVLALAALTLSLAGCGKKKIANPYEPATLAQAVSGESPTKLFRYELDPPKVLAHNNKMALLMEEDRLEFLCADNLAILDSLSAGSKYGVRRAWNGKPEVYLILEHVIQGEDTTFVTANEPPIFPSYQPFEEYDRSEFVDLAAELSSLGDADQHSMLRAYGQQGEKVWLTGRLSRSELAGKSVYTLQTNLGRFNLEGVAGAGELFLHAVLAEGGQVSVGGVLGEVYRRTQQEEAGGVAPVRLMVFRFHDYAITNG